MDIFSHFTDKKCMKRVKLLHFRSNYKSHVCELQPSSSINVTLSLFTFLVPLKVSQIDLFQRQMLYCAVGWRTIYSAAD